MSSLNLGRVQGGSIFVSSVVYEENKNVEITTLSPSTLRPLVGDHVLFTNGEIRKIDKVEATTITLGDVVSTIQVNCDNCATQEELDKVLEEVEVITSNIENMEKSFVTIADDQTISGKKSFTKSVKVVGDDDTPDVNYAELTTYGIRRSTEEGETFYIEFPAENDKFATENYVNTECDALKCCVDKLEDDCNNLEASIDKMETDLHEVEDQVEKVETNFDELERRVDTLEDPLKELHTRRCCNTLNVQDGYYYADGIEYYVDKDDFYRMDALIFPDKGGTIATRGYVDEATSGLEKMVTTDTEQTITGAKNFTQPIFVNDNSSAVTGIKIGIDKIEQYRDYSEGEDGSLRTFTFPNEDGVFATQEYVGDRLATEVTVINARIDDIEKKESGGSCGCGDAIEKLSAEVIELESRIGAIEDKSLNNSCGCAEELDKLNDTLMGHEARIDKLEESDKVPMNMVTTDTQQTISDFKLFQYGIGVGYDDEDYTEYSDGHITIHAVGEGAEELTFTFPSESGTIATQEYIQEEIKKSLDNGIGSGTSVSDKEFVTLDTAQTIAGEKTFSESICVGASTEGYGTYYGDGHISISTIGGGEDGGDSSDVVYTLTVPEEDGTLATQEYVQDEIKKTQNNTFDYIVTTHGETDRYESAEYHPDGLILKREGDEFGYFLAFPDLQTDEVLATEDYVDTAIKNLGNCEVTQEEFDKLAAQVAEDALYIDKLEKRLAALEEIIAKM